MTLDEENLTNIVVVIEYVICNILSMSRSCSLQSWQNNTP